MRGGGQIRERQTIAREPVARAHQPADISQMVSDILARGAHRFGIRRAAALLARHMAFVDALQHQRAADFLVELVVEPAREPPHFDAPRGFLR
jgi:hypothetical protein